MSNGKMEHDHTVYSVRPSWMDGWMVDWMDGWMDGKDGTL